MSYIEKKTISGRTYYYLTQTKRMGKGKWKKIRKYLGTTPTIKKGVGRLRMKSTLTSQQVRLVDVVKSNYSKKYSLNRSLWMTEQKRLVSFIYNTNAIEGNTLTYEETEAILKGKIPAEANERDVREVQNMKKCIDFLFAYNGNVDERLVLKLHSIEMKGILHDAGHYRTVNVRVGNYFPPIFQEVEERMRKFFLWYGTAEKILHPFELAALVHLKFVRIHPFRDGNGRMSRLLMNFVLMKNSYPLLNIFDAEKMFYYLVLQKVDHSNKEKPFVDYLFEVFIGQYKEFLGV